MSLGYLPLLIIFIFGTINLVGIRPDLLVRHLSFFGAGLILFYLLRKIHSHFFRINAGFFYWAGIILLIITYIVGFEVKGSTRWIDLYFFQLQPSELFKVFFIVYLAGILSTFKPHASKLKLFLQSLAFTLLPFFLILKQPDLGSAAIVFIIFLVMITHSQINKKHLLYFFVICLTLLPVLWFTSHDYQRNRILSFIGHSEATNATTYNMTQAIISVGSGNLTGRGLGMGKQSQLSFLPEYHTDFAFSSFIEQFGFLGGLILITLYLTFFGWLFHKIVRIMRKRDDVTQFEYYYTLGFSAYVIAQTSINIGMNVGILPIAGITLPLVSYGGSSLLTFMIALALLP